MSESASTFIGSSDSVHAGSGPQTNNYYMGPPPPKDAQERSPRKLAEDELRWLHRHFVPPDGFHQASDVLEKHRMVLLDGRPGNGRGTAARILLRGMSGPSPIQELPLEREEEDSRCLLDPEMIAHDDRLLLDLSTAKERLWAGVQTELSPFRQAIRDRAAGLVIILPTVLSGSGDGLAPALGDLRRFISRAPDMELDIVKHHMRSSGLDPTMTDLAPARVTDYLAHAPSLSRVATFAQFLCEAAGRGGDFTDWCEEALRGALRTPEQAARQFGTLRRGADRALLVTTAMLHGARADAVHRATELLLGEEPPGSVRTLLRRRALTERLAGIDAEITAGDRVRFTGLGVDGAVRTLIWRDFPDLREPLRDWAGQAVGLPGLTDTDRDRLVERVAEQCLVTQRPDDLLDLTKQWASAPRSDGPAFRAAAHGLRHGLRSVRYGGRFRHQIYDLSTSNQLSAPLRHVLIGVCAAEMSVSHPYAALVRLHHLARREGTGSEGREALLKLVGENHHLLRRMLDRLASSPWRVDPDIFLYVSGPGPLTDSAGRSRPLLAESGVRTRLVRCWSAVFRDRTAAQWAPAAAAWLAAVCAGAPYADRFLDVLVAGCEQRGDRFGLLYRFAGEWAAARQGRDEGPTADRTAAALPARVLQKISAAQHEWITSPRESTAP
ncbi:hypothetical protein [Streptomyces sp. NBC_01089]|uniref:hypothetical protein n=1 Tax=Streptomyces sp. NBC_01089 TaxID=2903747 RepID=UPI0038693E19|nr:hypothetical protein OG510_32080 [Streptomyces sp. NBC_01089]